MLGDTLLDDGPYWTIPGGDKITTKEQYVAYANAHMHPVDGTSDFAWDDGYGLELTDPALDQYKGWYYGNGNEITDPEAFYIAHATNDVDGNFVMPAGMDIIAYDKRLYPSGKYAYLDSFSGWGGDSVGLANLIHQLGIDPDKALNALYAWAAMDPNNQVKWLGSPYAFLLSMGIGDPSLAPIVMPVVTANQAALTAGQNAAARDWSAAHPAMSLHTGDYIAIAAGVASIAVPAVIGAFGAVGEAGWVSGEELVDNTALISAAGDSAVDLTGVDATGIDPDVSAPIDSSVPDVDSGITGSGGTSGDVSPDAGGTSINDAPTGGSTGDGSGGGQGGASGDDPDEAAYLSNQTPQDQYYEETLSQPDPDFQPQTSTDLANTNPSDLDKVVSNAQKYGLKALGIDPADPLGTILKKVGGAFISSVLKSGGHRASNGQLIGPNGQPVLYRGQPVYTNINPLTGLPFTNQNTFWYIGLGFLFLIALTSDRRD